MVKKWSAFGPGEFKGIPFTGKDLVRKPEAYSDFPHHLKDSEGCLSQWLEATQVHPISAMEWKCRPGWSLGPRTLDNSFWFCFINSRGVLQLHKETVPFRAGDLILIPKGQPHTLRVDPKVRATLLAVHFHANVFGNLDLIQLAGFPSKISSMKKVPWSTITSRLAHLYAIKPYGWSRMMTGEIFNLLVLIMLHHGNLFNPRHSSGRFQTSLLRLRPAMELIDKRFSDSELTVAQLASTISVSEVYFRKLLHRTTGMSPVSHLQQRRIQHAGILLRTTNLHLKEIANQCGFSDLTFFHRVFHRLTGHTPIAYRQKWFQPF